MSVCLFCSITLERLGKNATQREGNKKTDIKHIIKQLHIKLVRFVRYTRVIMVI